MKTKVYRHGEIAIIPMKKLPVGIEVSSSKVFATGQHGHNHSIDNGKLYFKKDGEYIFGYLVADNTSLLHEEHSPRPGDAKLPDGIYELRNSKEFINGEFKQIVD